MNSLFLMSGDPLNHVVQHGFTVGEGIWTFPILTNHVFMQAVAALLLIWLLPMAVRGRRGMDEVGRLVPARGLNAVETVCITLRSQIFEPNLGKHTDTFTPFLWSLFFFLAAVNILGMIPLADWFSWVPGHWVGGTGTGNIWTTGTLALITLLMVVINGLKYSGAGYIKHFFMGPPYLAWFIAILEILGLGFKAMALCIRLFANMLAGHIILAVMLSFIGQAYAAKGAAAAFGVAIPVVLGSVAFNFLEILVAFLHAFIFTTLTAVFLGQAVNIHHDDHEHDHGHDHDHGHGHATAH